MSTRVSVIIRTYNRAEYLRAAIESVLAQTYPDFELIVVDDGSTDSTRDVFAQYPDRLTPIFLAHTANQAAVMNAGVRCARGKLVAFLDDDDIWLPDKLRQQIALLDGDTRFGFVYGNAHLLYADGRLSAPVLAPDQIVRGSVLRALVRSMCVHTSTVVIRHAWFDRIGLFDESQHACEEYFFFLRLAQVTDAICAPEPVSLIREHAAKLSSGQGIATYVAAITALEMLLQNRALPWQVRLEAHRSIARHHTHVAKQLLELGQRDEARQHVRQALARFPLHRPAWRWAWRAFK